MARLPSSAARHALLDACSDLLASGGVRAVSIDEVVRRSGVAKTTLYRHFGGLEGLLYALVAARVRTAEAPDTGSLAGDLRAIQQAYLARFDEPVQRELFVWMVTNAMQDDAAASMFRSARFDQHGPTVVALQRAIARGELAPTINIELALHVIQGPLISRRVIEARPVGGADFDRLLEMTLAALQAV